MNAQTPNSRMPFMLLLAVCWSMAVGAQGQARREVVQNVPADVVWYDVEQAVQAQTNGEVVLAVDLSRQRLKTLPDLMLFNDLTYLIVSRNKLESFSIGFKKTDLKASVADHNRIQDFPEVLLKMPHVEHLSLGENYLRGIPLDIDMMEGLEILSLWGNVPARFPRLWVTLNGSKSWTFCTTK